MTESQLFVSSCSRRELTRRRGRGRFTALTAWLSHPAGVTLACVAVCAGAFVAGRGGI
jgi:hypothetical protein